MMKRILFILSMPNRGSWNGGWSGSGNNYTKTKQLTDKRFNELFKGQNKMSWRYSFGDGWVACVIGQVLKKGERPKKSDGFCGYDWMIDNIILNGEI